MKIEDTIEYKEVRIKALIEENKRYKDTLLQIKFLIWDNELPNIIFSNIDKEITETIERFSEVIRLRTPNKEKCEEVEVILDKIKKV